MRILAIDTSLAACSVAVWDDGRVLAAERRPMPRGQAEALVPMIEAKMAEAGLAYAGLDRFAVTIGPGSFTGIRVGLAAARGLALATTKPLIGIGTLEVLAAAAPDGVAVLAAIDAKRGQVYAQAFDAARQPLASPAALALAVAATLAARIDVAVGDGASLLALPPQVRVLAETLPDPARLAALAAARPPPADGRPPGPLSLRGADATPLRTP